MITSITHSRAKPRGTLTASILQSTNINEGQGVIYTIQTENIPDETVLNWYNTGTTTRSDFMEEVTEGTVIVNDGEGIVTLNLVGDMSTEGIETIAFSVEHADEGELDSMLHNVIDSSIEPAPITFEMEIVQSYCSGGATEITYKNLQGGNPPYFFAWTGSNGFTGNIPSVFVNDGTYRLTVSDSSVPEYYTAQSVTGEDVVAASPSSITFTHEIQGTVNVGEEWEVHITSVSGGNPQYIARLYEEGNPNAISQTDFNTSGSSGGGLIMDDAEKSYWVQITDIRGCISSMVKVFEGADSFTILDSSSIDASCYGARDGSVSFNLSGMAGHVQVNWNGGGFSNDYIFGGSWQKSGIGAGTYSVLFRDGYGREVTRSITVGQPSRIIITISNVTSNQFTVSASGGGTSKYTFAIGTGGTGWAYDQENHTFTNLSPGTGYPITVYSHEYCGESTFVTTEGALQISGFSATDQVCSGSNDGTATVNVSGGSGSYTYDWGFYGTNATATGLAPGNHTVTVTDTVWGDTTNSNVVINAANPLTFTYTSPTPYSLVINLFNSISFDYYAGAPAGSTVTTNNGGRFTIAGLNSNTTYNGITFISNEGCSITVNGVKTSINPPSLSTGFNGGTAFYDNTRVSCNGITHGIEFQVGSTDVEYTIDVRFGSNTTYETRNSSGTGAQIYYFSNPINPTQGMSTLSDWHIRIRDRNDHTNVYSEISGNGTNNPNVRYYIAGYSHTVIATNANQESNGDFTIGVHGPGIINNISPGPQYNYWGARVGWKLYAIQNQNDIYNQGLSTPALLISSGSIDTISGDITYLTFSDLMPDQPYQVQFTDSNGIDSCKTYLGFIPRRIQFNTGLGVSGGSIQCHGGTTDAYINAFAPEAEVIEYRMTSPSISNWQLLSQFIDLSAGDYDFEVRAYKQGTQGVDYYTSNGLNPSIETRSLDLKLTNPQQVTITAGAANSYTQNTVTVSGNIGNSTIYWRDPSSFEWLNKQFTGSQVTITGLEPGNTYQAYVVDSNGCQSNTATNISTKSCSSSINQQVIANDVKCYGTSTGSLTVSHDTQNYVSYQWYGGGFAIPGATGATLNNLSYENGKQYTVEITVDFECKLYASGSVSRVETEKVTATLVVTSNTSMRLNASGGTGSYDVTVLTPSGVNLSNIGSGEYSLTNVPADTQVQVSVKSAGLECNPVIVTATTAPLYKYYRTPGGLPTWEDWCEAEALDLNYTFYSTSDGEFMPELEGTYPTNSQGLQANPLEAAWFVISEYPGQNTVDGQGLWAAKIHPDGYWEEIMPLFCQGEEPPKGGGGMVLF